MVIDNVKSEHFKWLTEMAKTLQFNVVEIELTEDEEDAYLLATAYRIKADSCRLCFIIMMIKP
jgi:predicted nucleic acid-binding protein